MKLLDQAIFNGFCSQNTRKLSKNANLIHKKSISFDYKIATWFSP